MPDVNVDVNVDRDCGDSMFVFFFRPTPLGFRQVVQHVQLHVA